MTNRGKRCTALAILSLATTCAFAQVGVALGAAASQWNRQQELDMQQQQLELQKQQLEMMRLDQDRQLEMQRRRQAEIDAERKAQASEAQRCSNISALVSKYEFSMNPDERGGAKIVKEIFTEYGQCPPLSVADTRKMLDEATEKATSRRVVMEKVGEFKLSKKEYRNPKASELFDQEFDALIAKSRRGEIKLASFEEAVAMVHSSVLRQLYPAKSGKRKGTES